MNNRGDVLLAFALGAVAGILMAPDRGDVTRRRIAEKAGDMFNNAKDRAGSLRERVGTTADTLREQGRAVKEAVHTAKESYHEELSRPRTGLRPDTNP